MRPIAVDNFAGFGGASLGIEWAIGRPVDHAINHSQAAIIAHQMNHPETRHHCEDVFEIRPREVVGRRQVDLAWFSPDCFPAGTMILTRAGYRPIEDVEAGEEVLTHRLRWRRVTATMSTRKRVRTIQGLGHPGLKVSDEHPFYARPRDDVWDNSIRRYRRVFGAPAWVCAQAMSKDWFWGSPASFPESEAPSIPVFRRRKLNVDEKLMWLAGLYVADGWTRLTDTRAELVITCGKHEAEALRKSLSRWPRAGARSMSGELTWHERATRTAYQFATSHRGLVEWLREHFGHGAAGKLIPGWVLGLPDSMRRSFLEGYLRGDGALVGTTGNSMVQATTVSKALAFGLKSLTASLGYSASIYTGANRNKIEGRTINAKPYWSVRWRPASKDGRLESFISDGIQWLPIRKNTVPDGEPVEVFNLSVEEDESYVAEGVIVHNCTHHSVARGGKPREKNIRALAWITVRWAYHCRPRVMFLENVKEFQTWGPLDAEGHVIKSEKARTFEAFKACLSTGLDPSDPTWGEIRETIPDVPPEALKRGLGYAVEHRCLRACDYGAPTTRERFFMVMRADGEPIRWPEPTHGEPGSDAVLSGRLKPWPTAADCINWTLPCYSIFLTPEEIKAHNAAVTDKRDKIRVKRPLADNTMKRIARGTFRYVINARQPFLVVANHGGDWFRGQGVNDPMHTITGARDARGLVVPFLAGVGGRAGQTLEKSAGELVPTITAKGDKALVMPFLAKNYGGHEGPGIAVNRPMDTVTAKDHHALVAPFLVPRYGERDGQEPRTLAIDQPSPVVVPTGNGASLVAAMLTKYHGTKGEESRCADLPHPMKTLDSQNRFGLVTSHLVKLRGTCRDGQPVTEPMPTITGGGNHVGEVRAFLVKYYGQGCGADLRDPMHTITSKDRMGLVMTLGEVWQIADIGLRMLVPREQARAQGFPDTFHLIGTQAEQVSQIGNSVPPQFAEALVRANYREPRAPEIRTSRTAAAGRVGV